MRNIYESLNKSYKAEDKIKISTETPSEFHLYSGSAKIDYILLNDSNYIFNGVFNQNSKIRVGDSINRLSISIIDDIDISTSSTVNIGNNTSIKDFTDYSTKYIVSKNITDFDLPKDVKVSSVISDYLKYSTDVLSGEMDVNYMESDYLPSDFSQGIAGPNTSNTEFYINDGSDGVIVYDEGKYNCKLSKMDETNSTKKVLGFANGKCKFYEGINNGVRIEYSDEKYQITTDGIFIEEGFGNGIPDLPDVASISNIEINGDQMTWTLILSNELSSIKNSISSIKVLLNGTEIEDVDLSEDTGTTSTKTTTLTGMLNGKNTLIFNVYSSEPTHKSLKHTYDFEYTKPKLSIPKEINFSVDDDGYAVLTFSKVSTDTSDNDISGNVVYKIKVSVNNNQRTEEISETSWKHLPYLGTTDGGYYQIDYTITAICPNYENSNEVSYTVINESFMGSPTEIGFDEENFKLSWKNGTHPEGYSITSKVYLSWTGKNEFEVKNVGNTGVNIFNELYNNKYFKKDGSPYYTSFKARIEILGKTSQGLNAIKRSISELINTIDLKLPAYGVSVYLQIDKSEVSGNIITGYYSPISVDINLTNNFNDTSYKGNLSSPNGGEFAKSAIVYGSILEYTITCDNTTPTNYTYSIMVNSDWEEKITTNDREEHIFKFEEPIFGETNVNISYIIQTKGNNESTSDPDTLE